MIGSGLKKFAKEHNLKAADGIVYGEYRRYMLTLEEGAGWKSAAFAVRFADETSKNTVYDLLGDEALQKEHRITGYEVTDSLVRIIFHDNPGTLPKMRAFIDLFCDKLSSYGVHGVGYCACCGLPDSALQTVRINNDVMQMHASCALAVTEQKKAEKQEVKQKGSAVTGAVGAALGGLIGSIPWMLMSYFGWFVSWLGFLIGIAAKKGYELFKGKETKIKAVIIVIVTALVVLCAEYGTYLIAWMVEIGNDPELSQYELTILDVSTILTESFFEDAEMQAAIIGDLILGWVFAGLGIWSTVREIFSKAKKNTALPVVLDD